VLLLAAGAARRMRGRDKLLEPVAGGVPLLRERALACLGLKPLEVLVTLPEPPRGRGAALAGLALHRVGVADAAEGIAASLRAGVAAVAREAIAVLVVLADMPELRREDMARIITHAGAGREILRGASQTGRPGHPVLFPHREFARILDLRGDEGARAMLAKKASVRLVALPGRRALVDLDTPEDWARWRERRR